ncbi:hypothetical protein [Plantactinospora sp. BB1]|uniref:hypothetical protein n=1 Tax=Plantactinospora sp. BB1 TaxID=2071627 RepID=UPI0018FE367D|nr:hypothetical protein [Plantactinospora sp. BB1]
MKLKAMITASQRARVEASTPGPVGPPSSTPTVSTYATAGGKILPSVPLNSSLRSKSRATPRMSLHYHYITQGRVEADRPALSPRRLTRYLLIAPDQLKEHQRKLVDALTSPCPQMTALAGFIGSFTALLTPASGNDNRLDSGIAEVKTRDLPHLHTFTRGLGLDRDAVNTTLAHPCTTAAPKASTPKPNSSSDKYTDAPAKKGPG